MNKKKLYITPTAVTYQVKPHSMLAGSNDPSTTSITGGGFGSNGERGEARSIGSETIWDSEW